jgi:putative ABC transport system permease protein
MHDIRYALRALGKSRGFTLTASLTLAIGIGSAVATFSIVNAVLLRPLPLEQPDRLALIEAQGATDHHTVGASWTKFQTLRDVNHTFGGVSAWVGRNFTYNDGVTPVKVPGARVSASFFDVLGVVPQLGRTFRAEEDVEGAAPVCILSYGFWRQRLAADPAIVGRAIRLDGRETVVVGVLPQAFRIQFTDLEPAVYMTQTFAPVILTAAQIQHGAGFMAYLGRLKAGVTFAQAQEDLARVDALYRQQFGSNVDASRFELHAKPYMDSLVGDVRRPLTVLMGAVLLVLLIACANVAHLLLARATTRRHETALRLALGASRPRLIRQLLCESVILSLLGCAGGVWLAWGAIGLLAAYGPANIPRLKDAAPDATVLGFAIAASVATAFVFGLVPALRAAATPAGDVLKDSRAGGLTSGSTSRVHNILAISETAITLALLVAAGLLTRTFVRMASADPGFDPRGVYAANIALPRATYTTPAAREAFFSDLIRRVQQVPGLSLVGATSVLPIAGSNFGFFFYVEGQAPLGPGKDPLISVRHVSPDYFRVLRIPVERGRPFTDADNANSRPVAIINDTTARRYFPGVDPIGRHLANDGDRVMREIVGVAGDVHFDGPAKSGQEELYLPYRQVPWPTMTIVAASNLPVSQVVGALRHEVAQLDPDQAVAEVRLMDDVVATSMTQQRFAMSVLGAFALIAVVLAVIGLYGVTALFVGQRRHEFGIRLALGARPVDVLGLVMTRSARLVAAGVVAGLALAVVGSRLLSGLLFGVTATNAATYAAATLVVSIIGLVAAYIPARRAVHIDPIQALRE